MSGTRAARYPWRAIAPALVLALCLLAGSCAQRTSPTASSDPASSATALLAPLPAGESRDLFGAGHSQRPLAVGQRWDYLRFVFTRLVSPGQPDLTVWSTSPWREEITGETVIDSQPYFLMVSYDPRHAPPLSPPFAVREDATGFYRLDLFEPLSGARAAGGTRDDWVSRHEAAVRDAAASSPHRAAFERAAARTSPVLAAFFAPELVGNSPIVPPGWPTPGEETGLRSGRPRAGEHTMLLYPLFRGSRWIVSEPRRQKRTVVGRERANVPAGEFMTWVLQARDESLGPNDRVQLCYAAEGLILVRGHIESAAIDELDNPIGLMITDSQRRLERFTPGVALAGR